MTVRRQGGYLSRPAPSGLADVIEIVLDKGIVIDAYVRASLLGIELFTIDARVVVASVDTYLRFAEAANRLDLLESGPTPMTDLVEESTGAVIEHVASSVAETKVEELQEKAVGKVEEVTSKVVDAVLPGSDETKGDDSG